MTQQVLKMLSHLNRMLDSKIKISSKMKMTSEQGFLSTINLISWRDRVWDFPPNLISGRWFPHDLPWYLRHFSVIYEVKAYRDTTMTWFSTKFDIVTVISWWSLHYVTENPASEVMTTSKMKMTLKMKTTYFRSLCPTQAHNLGCACYFMESVDFWVKSGQNPHRFPKKSLENWT